MNPTRTPSAPSASRWFDVGLLAFGALLLVLSIYWFTHLIGAAVATPTPVAPVVAEDGVIEDVAEAESALVDEAFGVAMSGRALRRIVQILQWREVASVPLAVGDEVVSDQVDYQLVWSERLIDSSRFAEPQKHINPPAPPYRSWSTGAQSSTRVDSGTAAAWQHVPTNQVRLPDNLMAVFRAEGAWLVTMAEGELPQAGDLRVRFELLPASSGSVSDNEAAAEASAPTTDPVTEALVWIARAAAFILATLGAGLVFRGASRVAAADSWLQRLPAIAVLSLSIWVAVAAVLAAAAITRVF